MGKPTRTKGTPVRRARKLEHVERFVGASEEEVRDAYRAKVRSVTNLLELAWELLQKAAVGSDDWNQWAARIDALDEALDGWAPGRRARMLLLAAMDDGLDHFRRMGAAGPGLPRLLQAARVAHSRGGYDASERLVLKQAYLEYPMWQSAWMYESAKGTPPADVSLFVAFLFRLRSPDFARGLVTKEGCLALRSAIEVWGQGRGSPGKAIRVPKWDACNALVQAVGLPGTTPDALEADWREWKRTHR